MSAAKLSWSEKLKRYRKDQSDHYAMTILEPPVKVPLLSAMRFPGVAILMGDIRSGKTGLAHEVTHQFHDRRGIPACLHMPMATAEVRKKIQKMVPKWMKVTCKRSEWTKDSVVIYDEAAQSAHARRSQSGDAVELDDLLAISGQRRQLIIFISHHSRKLDLNVCTAVHRIIWKRPTYAHRLWERDEMADFTAKAFDFFGGIKGDIARKKSSLVLDLDNFRFLQTSNALPEWWGDDLSCLFQDALMEKKKEVVMGNIVR